MNDLRASGGTRNLRTSTKSNEMPRELGICCEKCNNRLVELKRQVMRLILPEIQSVIQSQKKTKNVVSLFIQLVNFCAPWEKVCGKKAGFDWKNTYYHTIRWEKLIENLRSTCSEECLILLRPPLLNHHFKKNLRLAEYSLQNHSL